MVNSNVTFVITPPINYGKDRYNLSHQQSITLTVAIAFFRFIIYVLMKYEEAKKRLLAAQALLSEETTTREKFSSIRTLLQGINPKIDKTLDACENELSKLEKLQGFKVIEVTLENLPELTEEQKKRKKILLFFINTWNQLKNEVKRVQKELDASHEGKSDMQKKSHLAKVFNFAKGPFGIITIIAVGIVLVLQATSVHIVIKNNGCDTIPAPAAFPIPLPGFSLPKDPIPANGSATVTISPITININGTQAGSVTVRILGMSFPYQVSGNISDITLNGSRLLGKETEVHLSERKEHILILSCVGK